MNPPGSVIGIDLGGTKVRIGLVTTRGELLRAATWPTPAQKGPGAVIAQIRTGVDEILADAGMSRDVLLGAGIGAPGPVDVRNGVISLMPNLPGWEDFPLQASLEEGLGIAVAVGNDASLAALAEHRFGAGRGATDVVYISLGTGVGGGIIANNQLCQGAAGAAGEIGHMVLVANGLPCSCGNRGCLEAYCSGRALERQAARQLQEGRASAIPQFIRPPGGAITGEAIERAARAGDALANEIIREAAEYLGHGVVSLVHLSNPDVVVFGGGLLAMADLLIEPAIELVRSRAFPLNLATLRFRNAELGGDAGVLGAAALALEAFNLVDTNSQPHP